MPNAMLIVAATPRETATAVGGDDSLGAVVGPTGGGANVVDEFRIITPVAKTVSKGILLKKEQNVNSVS